MVPSDHVLKDFDEITKLFKKLQKYSQELVSADKKNENQYKSLEKKYKKIQKEMVTAMKAVHFNSSTIEALMEALYELNKKLLLREGKMLRMALSCGVKRELFVEQYLNFNFEKNWIHSLLSLNDKNWEKFINRNHIEINKIIEEITEFHSQLVESGHQHELNVFLVISFLVQLPWVLFQRNLFVS
mgnify:CR=1 FL=1